VGVTNDEGGISYTIAALSLRSRQFDSPTAPPTRHKEKSDAPDSDIANDMVADTPMDPVG
jgi:hypothetical protein